MEEPENDEPKFEFYDSFLKEMESAEVTSYGIVIKLKKQDYPPPDPTADVKWETVLAYPPPEQNVASQ